MRSLPDVPEAVAVYWDDFLQSRERRALLVLARQESSVETLSHQSWADLQPSQRERLITAFRDAVVLGSECARALLGRRS